MNKHLHRKETELLFEDTNRKDKVVGSRNLPSQDFGKKVDYHKIANSYIPKGYQFVSHDQLNSSVIKPNNSYIIYVKAVNKERDGEVVIRYDLHGDPSHVIKREAVDHPAGSHFDAKKYVKNAPAGYQINKVIHGKQITQFTDHRQYLDVSVSPDSNSGKKDSHKVDKSSQVTDGILYQNADNGNIESTAVISGPRGMKINYKPYIRKGSKYMPKGYRFYRLFTNTDRILVPNVSYTILVKPVTDKQHTKSLTAKPGHSSDHVNHKKAYKESHMKTHKTNKIHGVMEYHDTKTNKTVKAVPIEGRQGHSVNYSDYMMANRLPLHYHLAGLGAHASNYFKPQARYVILVEADQSHPAKSQIVNETFNYRNARTNQLIDSQHINGPEGLSVDYKQYVPKGYRFVRLGHDSRAYLSPNAHCDVLILPKVSVHSKINKRTNSPRPSSADDNLKPKQSSKAKSKRLSNERPVSSGSNVSAPHINSKFVSPQQASVPHKSNPQMPQIGSVNKAANIGTILENLGKSLSALGHAIGHHQI